ncbi:methyl-accepting chemotaxis protein [Oxalobacteraceae bacterium R-40]|uniref:Methyl-accepting chemotaxis protein n=1 Tax=Keguizhuia sedimenti TaxID=3064264 RepID=A0ABU1BRN1_9BURK|nr:methyl-accepting chemotaxis protein [Oxalobacteraceae bacterium R-40]
MRNNLPVTDREYILEEGRPIVSKTDLKGKITYVNPYFTEVSGFEESELMGAPHNIVRHPDMPAEAFEDLWTSLKQGELWSAPVKNRRKNGDLYWVIANVTPITEFGQVVGYMSVRTKPTAQQIEAATAAYAEMRKGEQSRLFVRKGNIEKKGWRSSLRRAMRMPVKVKLAAFTLAQSFLMVGVLAWAFAAADSDAFPKWAAFSCLAGLLLNLSGFWFVHTRILKPVNEASAMAESLAGGDLSRTSGVSNPPAADRLLRALGQLNVNLVAAIGDIREIVSAMNSATSGIAAGNTDLSSRTEAQAASLEETASSMEEFASTVTNNAGNAQDATRLANNAAEIAAQGGVAVGAVGRTMNEISSSAKHVADIISVIDGIAFQTNILALNAAVEAARAGESGRGFAVVASEVRSLAQRSATSAKEIKALIDESMQKVETGNQLVTTAEGTMGKVVEAVAQVSGIVSQIALASKEQAIGVQQVNQAVSEMDRITQRNAALVEEAAAAASGLHQEAQQLSHAVSVFNIPSKLRPLPHMALIPSRLQEVQAPQQLAQPKPRQLKRA